MDPDFLKGIANIVLIDLVLSGDNAVVIAMACMGLPLECRRKAIFLGATLAVALRVVLIFIAAVLMKIPYVQVVAGLLLAWVAVRLLFPREEQCINEASCSDDFKKAVLTILSADLLMSLDNVLAVAGASKGNLYLLAFGIALSIPIVMVGSNFLTNLMQRFSWLIYVGAAVLAWTAIQISRSGIKNFSG